MKQYLGESSSTALIISQRPPNYTADRRERSPPGQPEHHSRSQAKLAGWQPRPHEALRDPLMPRRKLSPNEMYTALVAAAGYLPVTLAGEDYLELLPAVWRQVNAYGIRIGYRTYDCPERGPLRLQHSGITARRGLWEVHYDPYDASHAFIRTPDGWVTAPWTHLPMISAPFAEFTWRHARRLAAEKDIPGA